MSGKNKSGRESIEVNLTGDVSGQVAIGENIRQSQHKQSGVLTERERQALETLFAMLKEQVASQASAEQKEAALEQVTELEQTVTAETPDVSTMQRVRDWFVGNVPQLAGAVTGLIVNPIVGKLVEAAGETIAGEFKRRFSAP